METDEEIALYRALSCADWMEEENAWIHFYRFGLTRNITPREELKEKYKELTEKGKQIQE